MEKKILFVEPTGAFANVFAKFMSIPLLGPVYLATMARQAGYHADVISENILGRHVTPAELAAADILCLSCITTTVERGKSIAREYRRLRQDLGRPGRTLIGGIHASMLPQDVAADFDQVVTGEAEGVFLDLMAGRITDPLVRGTPLKDLDSLPLPDFTVLKGQEKIRILPSMTSRGCPYDCNFCSVTEMFGRGYRTQSPERVIREITRYHRGTVFFADDNFTESKRRTRAILQGMRASGFRQEWTAQVRASVTKDAALIGEMKAAGCTTVYVGFESINPQALLDMKKKQTVEDIKNSIRIFHDNGIQVHGMFILGNDADTPETLKATAEFSQNSGVDFVQYMILTPLPGTKVFRQMEQENRLLHRDWNFYDALHVVFQPKNMTAQVLQEGMVECFSDFYNYTNAANEALNAVFETAATLGKRLITHAHMPSFYPALVRMVGKGILQDWVKKNQGYLQYLAMEIGFPKRAGLQAKG